MIKEKYDIIYNLSHTDLDGYGSQYMINVIKPLLTKTKIKFFNADYDEVTEKINLIFENVLKNKDKKMLFLITDIGVSEKIIKKMNNFLRGNKNIDLTYKLLDHHKSNLETSKQNDWYICDTNKCGSSLTADFVISEFNVSSPDVQEHLLNVGDFIEAHDIWKVDSEFFNQSNYLSEALFSVPFINELEEVKRNFYMNFIFFFMKEFSENSYIVEDLEKNINVIIKNAIKFMSPLENELEHILNDRNLRTTHKVFYFQALQYREFIKPNEIIDFNGKKGLLLYDTNGTLFQYFSKYFLERFPEFNFMIHFKSNGKCSLRSADNTDVSVIAKLLDYKEEGGGHPQASGCKIKVKQEPHSKNEAVKIVKNIINEKLKNNQGNFNGKSQ